MKTIRLLAWMLVLAMLVAVCPAFGEALEVELPDGGALEAPTDDALLVEGSPADLDLEQELSIELSGDELSGDLADALEGFLLQLGEAFFHERDVAAQILRPGLVRTVAPQFLFKGFSIHRTLLALPV